MSHSATAGCRLEGDTTKQMTWTNQRYSLPNNAIPPKEGISGGLMYFSHELVVHWCFCRWVTAYASLVFFSLLTLTKRFFGDCFIFTPKFSCFSSSPSPWVRGHEWGATWSSAAHQSYSTCPFPQQCWCAPHTLEKQLLCVLPRIPSPSSSTLSPTSPGQADLKKYQAWSITSQY